MRFLLVRTDRIGDVVLTTPAVAALRKAYPEAWIAMMVTPQTREIVDGNPHLNEVIVYDRSKDHKGFAGFWSLVGRLRQGRFDVAVNFHTKKRTNLMCFLAGIPRRIGYRNNKFGFLLTDGLRDTRPQGAKHEAEYCLDVLAPLGVTSADVETYLPANAEADQWAERFLRENQIQQSTRIVAIHPGASCVSKRWPAGRFAGVAHTLQAEQEVAIILVGGPDSRETSKEIKRKVPGQVLDVTGIISLTQLAALLKRCVLLISNDSGPVHVAASVGTPVISIFGRNQAGLSPVRWRPLQSRSMVLHKEVGCEICLAHDCQIDFECLKAVTEQEVCQAARELLVNPGQ